MSTALVLGVRSMPDLNIGFYIADLLKYHLGEQSVTCADAIKESDAMEVDVTWEDSVEAVFKEVQPSIAVYSVGINLSGSLDSPGLDAKMAQSFAVNVTGMVNCIQAWRRHMPKHNGPGQFVAIVSNSSRIPRTNSLAYCASKAAQAMAVRVAAREMAGVGGWVYGYEPGLVRHTPMTTAIRDRMGDRPLHRMRGIDPSGIAPEALARLVVHNILNGGEHLNGTLIPFDADEL